nr:hypothetical protein [Tanacetum cinerariifolium]
EENKSNDDETPFDSEKGSDSEFDQQDDEEEVKDDDEDDDDDDDDDDKSEGDEDRGMDSDDVQDKKADVGMTDEEVSNFAPPVIKKMIQESLNQVNLAKAYSHPQSTYEAAASLIEFLLKKIMIDKMNSSESYLIAPEHQECYDGLIKSYNLDKVFFSSYDVYSLKRSRDDKDKDEGSSTGSDRGGDYSFDLSKPFPLIMRGNRQSVPVEFFINNDLKYLQRGTSTMTYTTSTTKTKAAQYDLPSIEDMVPNI